MIRPTLSALDRTGRNRLATNSAAVTFVCRDENELDNKRRQCSTRPYRALCPLYPPDIRYYDWHVRFVPKADNAEPSRQP
jgi:hypothetical protein